MPDTVRITGRCPFCGKQHEMEFPRKELDEGIIRYDNGALLQDAWPTFTPEQREFLKTRICPDCWNSL